MSNKARNEDNQESDDKQPVDEEFEAALADALGEDSRAADLRQMQAALQNRRNMLLRELDTADEDERTRLQKSLTELDEQILILAEEADITNFIEDSVRVGLEMRRLDSS